MNVWKVCERESKDFYGEGERAASKHVIVRHPFAAPLPFVGARHEKVQQTSAAVISVVIVHLRRTFTVRDGLAHILKKLFIRWNFSKDAWKKKVRRIEHTSESYTND